MPPDRPLLPFGEVILLSYLQTNPGEADGDLAELHEREASRAYLLKANLYACRQAKGRNKPRTSQFTLVIRCLM